MTEPRSFTMPKRNIILLAGVGLLVLLVLVGLVRYSSVRKEAINQENALEQQYRANQNELSSYTAGAREQFSVVVAQTAALERILGNAVKGRYEGEGQHPGTGGALFSAIKEAYPDLDLSAYNRIVDYIQSKREAYKNVQNKLLDMIASYENYLTESIFRSPFLGSFPSKGLEARVGRKVYKGEDALDQMKNIVLTPQARNAYETGDDTPLEFPTGTTGP